VIPYNVPTYKPYTYVLKRGRFFWTSYWGIRFEGTDIGTWNGSEEDDVKRFVQLLNTAWVLGHGTGWIERDVAYEPPKEKIPLAGSLDKLVPVNTAELPPQYQQVQYAPLNGYTAVPVSSPPKEDAENDRRTSPYSQNPPGFNQKVYDEYMAKLSEPWDEDKAHEWEM
jgi:hypothetical protein